MPNKPRSFFRIVLFGILVLLLGLAAVEVAFRLSPLRVDYFFQELPGGGLTLNPDYQFPENVAREYGCEADPINSLGFRGSEFPLEKPPGTRRILVVGDSQTFGMTHGDDSFPAQTHALLKSSWEDAVEVINGGRPGASTFEELRTFRGRGAKIRPDVLVLAFYAGNDIEENRENEPCVFYKTGACSQSDYERVPAFRRSLISLLYRFQITRRIDTPFSIQTF